LVMRRPLRSNNSELLLPWLQNRLQIYDMKERFWRPLTIKPLCSTFIVLQSGMQPFTGSLAKPLQVRLYMPIKDYNYCNALWSRISMGGGWKQEVQPLLVVRVNKCFRVRVTQTLKPYDVE
jgi:hypothetical protein